MTLYGGSITGNTAGTQGGGIYNAGKEDDSVYDTRDKKITLYPTRGSRITVTGNTVNGAANNLATTQCIVLDREYGTSTTLLSTGSRIGVTVLEPANDKDVATINSKSNQYKTGAMVNDIPCFTLDDDNDGRWSWGANSGGATYIHLTIYHKHTLAIWTAPCHDISVAGHSRRVRRRDRLQGVDGLCRPA